jgi:hypothetical protein
LFIEILSECAISDSCASVRLLDACPLEFSPINKAPHNGKFDHQLVAMFRKEEDQLRTFPRQPGGLYLSLLQLFLNHRYWADAPRQLSFGTPAH